MPKQNLKFSVFDHKLGRTTTPAEVVMSTLWQKDDHAEFVIDSSGDLRIIRVDGSTMLTGDNLEVVFDDKPENKRWQLFYERLKERERRVEVCVVNGVEGKSVYLNDYRVAGTKPWGGGKVILTSSANLGDVFNALKLNDIARECGLEVPK